jgi:hypothetical protein
MPALSAAASATYKAAGYMRRNLHVDDSLLLRLVATGRVRVQRTSAYPRYCVEDVQNCLREDNRHAGQGMFLGAT